MNSFMNRRRFLFVSAASITGYATWLHMAKAKDLGVYTVCYADENTYRERGAGFGMMSFDLDRGTTRQFSTPINVHDVVAHPERPHYAVGANKFGSNFGEFDLKSGEVLKIHQLPDHYKLLGHMTYSDDGRYLCATGVKGVTDSRGHHYRNVLFVLSPKSLEIERLIALPGCNPSQHDCRFLPKSHIVATTGGQNIAYVDVSANHVEVKAVSNIYPKSAIRHFSMSKSGTLAIQCNVIDGVDGSAWSYHRGEMVVAERSAARAESIEIPENLRTQFDREVLDLCFSPSGEIFAVVVQGLGKVTFWNFATGAFIKEIEIPWATRVSLSKDGKYFVVLSRFGLRFISTDTISHLPELDSFDAEIKKVVSATTYLSHARMT